MLSAPALCLSLPGTSDTVLKIALGTYLLFPFGARRSRVTLPRMFNILQLAQSRLSARLCVRDSTSSARWGKLSRSLKRSLPGCLKSKLQVSGKCLLLFSWGIEPERQTDRSFCPLCSSYRALLLLLLLLKSAVAQPGPQMRLPWHSSLSYCRLYCDLISCQSP